MSKFTIEFKCDNDAFYPNPRMEIMAILRDIVQRVDEESSGGLCYDSNGNAVGNWSYERYG